MTALLGLDLGGTNIKSAVVTVSGADVHVVATASAPTPTDGADAILDAVASLAGTHLAAHDISAIGMTFPGVVNADTGIPTVTPNLPGGWADRSVSARLGERLGRAVAVLNDARAFTLAESRAGAAAGAGTVLAITLGTGIGGGVAIDGNLHGGHDGIAGEFGHQTVVPDGPLCGCGNRGCIEAVARPAVIAAAAGTATPEEAFRRSVAGDERARAAIADAVAHLAIGIGNAHALLSPDVVVIGGGVAEAGDALLAPLHRAVARRIHLTTPDRLRIVTSRFGPYAGAVGASLWARDRETRDAR